MSEDPRELLQEGDLAGALKALQDQVRARPDDAKLRIFLFQLLCVTGDWQRAITQLKLCGQMQASAIPMAQTYREAIICEVFREKVFAGEKQPLIFGEPGEWIAPLVESVKVLAGGKPAEAAALRDRAFEGAPAVGGSLNGTRFEWIADADMRLGPVLETILNGRYFWVPFSAIRTLKFEDPADLRDMVWTPGQMRFQNGGEFVVLIPTRYPLGAATTDAERLSRATSWTDLGAETFAGSGQRLLATDAGDTGLLDARTLEMDAVAGAGGAADG